MSDFTIFITPTNSGHFKYLDEKGNDAFKKQHALAGKTIQWTLGKLPQGSSASISSIVFKKVSPIGDGCTLTFSPDTTYTFNCTHAQEHDYTVNAQLNGVAKSDDPEIIFDDGTLEGDALSRDQAKGVFSPDPTEIAAAAEKAGEALLDKVAALQNAKGSGVQFYPHGITDIEVTVNVSGISITVKVSGPDSGT